MRVCLDLNVWCAQLLAARAGREDTACQAIVRAVRRPDTQRPLQLVISWGMLLRLEQVLTRKLEFPVADVAALIQLIAGYAAQGPALTLGGVGVIPIVDAEDRHVLETAWAGEADVLVSGDVSGLLTDAEVLIPDRLAVLMRGGRRLYLVHPFAFAAWLGGHAVPGLDL
jgi:predicted nucleic acid-binding protein